MMQHLGRSNNAGGMIQGGLDAKFYGGDHESISFSAIFREKFSRPRKMAARHAFPKCSVSEIMSELFWWHLPRKPGEKRSDYAGYQVNGR